MKATRINLCETVRNAFEKAGYSTVKAVNALNGELEALECSKVTSDTKGGTVNKKGYKVTVATSEQFTSKTVTPAMKLDAFNTGIEKLEKLKLGRFEVTIPLEISEWLEKFAKKPAEIPVA